MKAREVWRPRCLRRVCILLSVCLSVCLEIYIKTYTYIYCTHIHVCVCVRACVSVFLGLGFTVRVQGSGSAKTYRPNSRMPSGFRFKVPVWLAVKASIWLLGSVHLLLRRCSGLHTTNFRKLIRYATAVTSSVPWRLGNA